MSIPVSVLITPSLSWFVWYKLSRPDEERNDSLTGYKGRVNNILLDRLDEWGLNPSETIVYACGHPGMIEDVKEKLENSDYTFLEERFWKD